MSDAAQARYPGGDQEIQEEDSVRATLRHEEARLLASLKVAHRDRWPAHHMRRVVERLLRIVWILELAEAEAAGDRLRVAVLELELRDIYRQRTRRWAA